MTVKELIAKLGEEDPKAEVHLAYPFGDYWATDVAPAVGNVSRAKVVFSDYHSMDKLAEEEARPEEQDGELRTVVVLSQFA